MQSLRINKWENYSLSHIISGKNADDVALLQLFLKDYKIEFNSVSLNASCRKCIREYHENYKQKFTIMEQDVKDCQFKLKFRYQNIPLRNFGDGYNVTINNKNLTDERALILLERYQIEKVFEVYPNEEELAKLKSKYATQEAEQIENEEVVETESETDQEVEEIETVAEVVEAPSEKPKRGRKSNK